MQSKCLFQPKQSQAQAGQDGIDLGSLSVFQSSVRLVDLENWIKLKHAWSGTYQTSKNHKKINYISFNLKTNTRKTKQILYFYS